MSTQPIAQAGADYLSQLIFGFASTQVILTADELKIFITLNETGPLTAESLATKLHLSHVETLERLLNALVSYQLLQRDADAAYSLNDLSRTHLLPGAPAYMGGFFEHIRRDLYPLWSNLPHAVRENKPQWARIPGGNPAGPFETIYQDEQGLRSFMDAMFSGTYGASCEHAMRFDFSRFRHICDIGGASGGFFAGVLPNFPQVRGTIFDLPPVEKPAMETMGKFGLADRVDFHPGDFFKDPLPTGPDMFVLGHILHDWDTTQGTALLKRIYDALPEGGAVFIGEMLLNDDKVSPAPSVFMDINMLVATTGKERTGAEYENWLKEIGFTKTEHQHCETAKSFVVGYK